MKAGKNRTVRRSYQESELEKDNILFKDVKSKR